MAIAYETKTEYTSSGTTITSDSFTAAGGSGSNRTLVFIIGWKDESTSLNNPSVSSVTYNSVALTFRARARQQYVANTRSVTCEVWTLDNPATGSNTLAYTLSEESTGSYVDACALIYSGANNGVGTNVGSATGASTTPSVAVTSTASDSYVVGGVIQDAQTTFTPGTDDTERADFPNTSGRMSMWVAETPGTSGSVTISATSGSSTRWSMVGVEILASGGASPITVNLSAAALAASGQVLDPQPGAVSVSLSAAALVTGGQSITISSATLVSLSPAVLSALGQALDPQPGVVTVILDPAVLSVSGGVITIGLELTIGDARVILMVPAIPVFVVPAFDSIFRVASIPVFEVSYD